MRKKKVIKRHSIKPDKKFNSTIVAQLINKVMRGGEKRIATRIVYQAAEIIEKWFKERLTTKKVTESKKIEEKNASLKEIKKNELVNQSAEIDSTSELLKTSSSPFLTVLEGALANVKPSLETKRRKFGASNRRVPAKVEEKRALILASRWIIESAKIRDKERKESNRPMFEKLAGEIIDAYNKTGGAFKKKENIHKEAMGNVELSAPLQTVKKDL